jgi:hypothetical protein
MDLFICIYSLFYKANTMRRRLEICLEGLGKAAKSLRQDNGRLMAWGSVIEI